MPMHFFRMLQTLTSFLENMGAGKDVLSNRNRQTIRSDLNGVIPLNIYGCRHGPRELNQIKKRDFGDRVINEGFKPDSLTVIYIYIYIATL